MFGVLVRGGKKMRRSLWWFWFRLMMRFKYRCEKCNRWGVCMEGMDDFVASLCKSCYKKLLADYTRDVSR